MRIKSLIGIACLFVSTFAIGQVKGIYISQDTLENTQRITYLIQKAQETGINSFVIDLEVPRPKYEKNLQLVKAAGIQYIARIIVFPNGATGEQMHSMAYREKRLALINKAVAMGANQIQLDYIRYNSARKPSSQNTQDVKEVIKWFKDQLAAEKTPLQIDVFGITSFHEEKRIGQNPGVFASHVDAICPMVYPSHYEPYREHAQKPYDTVYSSLVSLKSQLTDDKDVKIYPYIELSNYRYPLSKTQRVAYIRAQLKAVNDADVDGWYAWSASNKYDYLFNVLGNNSSTRGKTETASSEL